MRRRSLRCRRRPTRHRLARQRTRALRRRLMSETQLQRSQMHHPGSSSPRLPRLLEIRIVAQRRHPVRALPNRAGRRGTRRKPRRNRRPRRQPHPQQRLRPQRPQRRRPRQHLHRHEHRPHSQNKPPPHGLQLRSIHAYKSWRAGSPAPWTTTTLTRRATTCARRSAYWTESLGAQAHNRSRRPRVGSEHVTWSGPTGASKVGYPLLRPPRPKA